MHIRKLFAAVISSAALAVAAGCATSEPAPAAPSAPAAPAAPSAAEAIQQRQSAMRQVGGASRQLGTPTSAEAAATIARVAQQFPTLFPVGSGPESGVPTRASAAIWSNAAGWQQQTRAFAAAAQAVAAATTPEARTAATQQLGGTCQSCHSQFRTP